MPESKVPEPPKAAVPDAPAKPVVKPVPARVEQMLPDLVVPQVHSEQRTVTLQGWQEKGFPMGKLIKPVNAWPHSVCPQCVGGADEEFNPVNAIPTLLQCRCGTVFIGYTLLGTVTNDRARQFNG